MEELVRQFISQAEALPYAVHLWFRWMTIVSLCFALLARDHEGPRVFIGTILIAIPLAMFIFDFTRNINILGIVHIIVWAPLLVYFYKYEFRGGDFNIKTTYGVWLTLLTATITISLLFDFRDVALVLMGYK